MNGNFTIVWAVFGVMVVYLGIFFGKRILQMKKQNEKMMAAVNEEKDRASHLDSAAFDSFEGDSIIRAVIYHINAKEERLLEDENYDGNLIPHLTHEELMIYTMFAVENSMEGGSGSIHTFFINDTFKPYVPYFEEAFTLFESYEVVTLLKEAQKLAILIENDQEDEIDEESDYATYNFTDFTNEILANLRSSNISTKITEYIVNNKESFIEK